jgi:hypothetical protein
LGKGNPVCITIVRCPEQPWRPAFLGLSLLMLGHEDPIIVTVSCLTCPMITVKARLPVPLFSRCSSVLSLFLCSLAVPLFSRCSSVLSLFLCSLAVHRSPFSGTRSLFHCSLLTARPCPFRATPTHPSRYLAVSQTCQQASSSLSDSESAIESPTSPLCPFILPRGLLDFLTDVLYCSATNLIYSGGGTEMVDGGCKG